MRFGLQENWRFSLSTQDRASSVVQNIPGSAVSALPLEIEETRPEACNDECEHSDKSELEPHTRPDL
jgi:hypothetical protein